MNRCGEALAALVWLAAICSGAVVTVAACNDNPLIRVPACRPGLCTCEEDPTQGTCKGYNGRPEGGRDPADAARVETSLSDASTTDAALDAPADAEDAAD
jgi:hypothetical protein